MTEVMHKAVRETTSEVKTLSYDTVLVGPADDIAEILQPCPGQSVTQDSAFSPRKHNSGRLMGTRSPRILTLDASKPR